MSKLIPAVMNWSGGKDSALALHYILQQKDFDIRYLLTTVNESFNRIAMHGVREELLIDQVNQLRLPLLKVKLPEMPDMSTYERIMNDHLAALKLEDISHSIYGDIFLEDLRLYRENQLAKHQMKAIFPLWQKESTALIHEFIDLGYKTIVVCAQDGLQDFCGRILITIS
jgi:diphthamide synthase (EF-2-diphthine--ammonia ligase)